MHSFLHSENHPAARDGATGAGGTPDARGPNRRVLIVEDNIDAAESLAQVVEFFGYQAEIAPDGPAALSKARAHPPDVVLCDIGLPGMDGYQVARAFRSDETLSSTRLIALSGYAQPEDRRQAAEAGFDRHVAKPITPEELDRLLAS